jgi:hypothetical protein
MRLPRCLLGDLVRIFKLALVHSVPFVLLTACPPPTDDCDTGDCVDDTGNPPVGANANLIGIGYNNATAHNELRSVDPATATVTTLTSFDFDSGGWNAQVITDPAVGVLYAVSSENTLYSFAMDGSAVTAIGTLSQPMQTIGLGNNELIGIGYNDATAHNELRSVDPATATVTTLTSFDFDSGGWNAQVITDPAAGVLYAVSSENTLYSFAMDGSAVTAIGTLSQPMQTIGLGSN